MQSPTALQKHGENSGSNPVGTGPFKLQSWQRGGELTLVRNDAYWGDKALLDKIVVTAIPDLNGRVSALEAGDADVIVEVPPSEVARLSKSNRVQILSAVTSRNQWLRFNELKPPFEKREVRRAAALATNRDAYIKGVMQGHATRARNIVGPGVVGYTELDPVPYDPAKAKELLAQAGLPGGFSTTMTCAPSDELICQAVVQDLAAVGINAKLQTLEVERDAWTVYVRPELVVEIAFSDVQESPRYPAGLALRFARVKRYREDKPAAEADTLQTVRAIFQRQRE